MGLLLVGFGIGFAGTSAYAGTAVSAVGYWNDYNNQAYIVTSTNNARAHTVAGRSTSAPAGYLGARGRLFQNGSMTNLVCEGTTSYNPTASYGQYGYSCTKGTKGTWNSYGVTRFWKNGVYNDVMTFNSPNQSS